MEKAEVSKAEIAMDSAFEGGLDRVRMLIDRIVPKIPKPGSTFY